MAKKKSENIDFDEDYEYGSGRYINQDNLLDKHDYELDEEPPHDEQDIDVEYAEVVEKVATQEPPYFDPWAVYGNDETNEDAPKKRRQAKPKLMGKHSLAYDVIFKGKKNVVTENPDSEYIIQNAGGTLDLSDDSLEGETSRSSIDDFRDERLKTKIRDILKTNTDINFKANRRKPARTDFNAYFTLLLKKLAKYGYTRTEIFIELSGYFSDNTWNMFQLLDKQFKNIIIQELVEKFGLSDMDKIDFIN